VSLLANTGGPVLLHGPPGTGKTLTAEAASEFFQCPLITTSARRLGTHASKVELELGRDSALCHAWGAIWLIEEADELWEQTTPQAPGTAVASTFMKHLDNFHGIVFLTTNHVKVCLHLCLCSHGNGEM
jgi:DNA polymerase III delta prime subunit